MMLSLRPSKDLRSVVWILGGFWVLWMILMVAYLFHGSLFDHAEPQMLVAAQQEIHGRPLYHALDAENLYSQLYGPLLYELLAGSLTCISNPILAGKVVIAILCGLTWIILYLVFHRMGGSRIAAGALGLIAFELLWYAAPISFWIRPDPVSLFAVSLGLGGLFLPGRFWPVLVLAIAIAIAIDSKLDGFTFLFPVFCVLVRRQGILFVPLLAVGTAALCLAPFLAPQVTLKGYLAWAFSMAGYGINFLQVAKDLFFFPMLLGPIVFFCPGRMFFREGKITEDGVVLISSLVTGILVTYPASQAGAGTHHYAPLSIWVGYLVVRALVQPSTRPQAERPGDGSVGLMLRRGLLVLWLLLAAVIFVVSVKPVLHFLADRRPGLVERNFCQILSRYPRNDMQMGYAGLDTYADTFVRPWLYAADVPCLYDPAAGMNTQVMHLPQTNLKRALAAEKYRYFIFPKGNRFTLRNCYTAQLLFDAEVDSIFSAHYVQMASYAYFDVYEARGKLKGTPLPVH